MKRLKLDIQKFATSGILTTPANTDGTSFYFYWSRQSYSIANNKSTIYWQIGINAAYNYSSNAVKLGPTTVNGTVIHSGGTYSNISRGTHTMFEGTMDIYHNEDGTKSFPASLSGWTWGSTWTSADNSNNPFVLDTIQRISKLDSVSSIDLQQRTNNIEGTFNAKYTRYNNNFTDNLVIQYLDRSDNSWTTIKTITNYVSGTDFTFTQQELNTLFGYDTTQTMINLQFFLKTYSGQTLIGDSTAQIFTYKIYDNLPIFSDFTFADINPTTLALTDDSSININNYSNIQITIPANDKATAQKGATIIKYKVNIGDKTIDIAYSDSESVSGTITGSPNGTYQVYAIDSRGNSTLVTKFASSQIEYTNITRNTNYSATRDDGGIGSNVSISFSGSIWNGNFGDVNNGFKTAKYLLKKTDSNNWIDLGSSMTNITPTITNNTYSFTGQIRSDNPDTSWDLDSSYDIKIILEDELSSVEFIMTVASATPNISLSRNGVGIMCDYDETLGGLLQIGGEKISKTLNAYSTSQTDTYSCNYINNLGTETVLYDGGTTGTTGTVNLSDSVENYNYIEIFYKQAQYTSIYSSVKVYKPSNTQVGLVAIQSENGGSGIAAAYVKINGNTITKVDYNIFWTNGGNDHTDKIYITRVIGWK